MHPKATVRPHIEIVIIHTPSCFLKRYDFFFSRTQKENLSRTTASVAIDFYSIENDSE